LGSSQKAEITRFLMDFKRTAQMKFTFVHRKKNMESLYQLGVTIDDVKNEIFNPPSRNSPPVRVGMDSEGNSASARFSPKRKDRFHGCEPVELQ